MILLPPIAAQLLMKEVNTRVLDWQFSVLFMTIASYLGITV